MKRTARDYRDLPHPKPVERIELNEEHTGRRLAAALALLAFGAALLVYAFMQLLTPETGWTEITAGTGSGVTCGGEFTFLYCLGSAGGSAAAENKAVTLLYTNACRTAYQLFQEDEEYEDVVNVCAINRHPNEELTVDGGLYRAFETLERYGSRALYLGPVYERQANIFYCQEDYQIEDYDPWTSEAVAGDYRTVAAYAGDPSEIQLELLGENRVRLRVSEAYLDYARREGLEDLIGFGWMKNAFICDYLAEAMLERQYTMGVISSYDGFVRNLDSRGTDYSLDLYARQGNTVYPAAIMDYWGPASLISLRNYPLNRLDEYRFYQLANGEIRTAYIDLRDGRDRTAANELFCYSRTLDCGELLLEAAPVYIAGALDEAAVDRLAEKDVHSIYCRGSVIRYTDPDLVLRDFYDLDGVRYSAEQTGPSHGSIS